MSEAPKNPYAPLDEAERRWIEAAETEDWRPSGDEALKREIIRAAKESQKKSKTVTFRLTEQDLAAIKQKAAIDGIPYQTLISALVHQYALGKVKLDL